MLLSSYAVLPFADVLLSLSCSSTALQYITKRIAPHMKGKTIIVLPPHLYKIRSFSFYEEFLQGCVDLQESHLGTETRSICLNSQ